MPSRSRFRSSTFILGTLSLIVTVVSTALTRKFTDWIPLPYRLELIRTIAHIIPHYPAVQEFSPDPQRPDLIAARINEPNSINKHFCYRVEIYNSGPAIDQQLNFDQPVHWAGGIDADGEPGDELLVSYADSSVAGLRLIKWPSREILWEYTFGPETWPEHSSAVFDNLMVPGPVIAGGDGNPPALAVTMVSGKGGLPRGLLLLNLRTGVPICHALMAGSVNSMVVSPADTNGGATIVAGTYSPDNGVRFMDTSDDTAYLYGFNQQGEQLWRLEFPGRFSNVLAVEYDRVAKQSLVVYAPMDNLARSAKVMIVNNADGRIEREIPLPELAEVHTVVPTVDLHGVKWWWITSATGAYLLEDRTFRDSAPPVKSESGVFPLEKTEPHGTILLSDGRQGELFLLNSDFDILATREGNTVQNMVEQRVGGEDGTWLWVQMPDRTDILRVTPNRAQVPQAAAVILGCLLGSIALCFGTREVVRMRIQFVRERKAKALRESFTVVASLLERHEITSPITTALREAMNIRQEIRTRVPGSEGGGLDESAAQIIRELNRTRDSLDPLIQILKNDPPALRPANFGDAIARIVDRTPLPAKISVDLEFPDEPVYADFDERWILIAIRNLLENSVNAMPDGGIIRILVGQEQGLHKETPGAGPAWLRLSDSGVGIPSDQLAHIFELGYSRTPGGKGIGLWLVKYIVEAHNAQLTCSSVSGSGTTFTLQFSNGQ